MRAMEMKTAAIAAVVLALLPMTAAADPPIVDNFDDNSIDLSWWTVETQGQATLQETNSRLEVAIPGSSTASFLAADVRTAERLAGDFDVQVDYALLTWPAGNGVRIGLTARAVSGAGAGVERVSRNANEYGGLEDYCTDIAGQVTRTITTDAAGTLRLQRVGSTLSGYYLSSGNWVLVSSRPWTTSATYLSLAGWSDSYAFARQDVRFAFDNFAGYFRIDRLVGDANSDGRVDFTDYAILESNFGTTTGATWGMGDFDGDGAVYFKDYQILEVNFAPAPPPPQQLVGDADCNGSVDFTDYAILESNFGTTTGATWAMADFDGDGDVDFTDYALLESNFGSRVPEPAAIWLLTGGGLALLRRQQ